MRFKLDFSSRIGGMFFRKRSEVKDFDDFIRGRETGHNLTRAAMQVSEPSFAAVWNNPDDAIYDRL